MGFYEEIAEYYDYIFPVSEDTINFLKKFSGNPPKKLLDIACGTGGYSIELAKASYHVTAIDIDKKMIENLKLKNKNLNINFSQANMLLINKIFANHTFNTIFCIGNSLVHLKSSHEIEEFIRKTKNLLIKNGKLIIQIINFDRIISENINYLPTIKRQDLSLEFKRLYKYDSKSKKVAFKAILKIKDKSIQNEIILTPIHVNELANILKNSGFKKINTYGNFNEEAFDKENSYLSILVAE